VVGEHDCGMASRHYKIPVPLPPKEAYDAVYAAAQDQGWIITRAVDATELRFRPEIKLKAGAVSFDGSGRTRVRFTSGRGRGRAMDTCVLVDTSWALSYGRAKIPALSLAKGLGVAPEKIEPNPGAEAKPGRSERQIVRVLVGVVLALAAAAFLLIQIPRDAKHDPEIPAVALGQREVYHLEIALVVFYGLLLLLTPVFWGLIRGRLPTEISSKGAKFAEDVDQSIEAAERRIDEQVKSTEKLTEDLVVAKVQIARLGGSSNAPRESRDADLPKRRMPYGA
jgi:hypothetical protein